MIKFGPSEGNRGAVIRWGKHWDNGLWVHKPFKAVRWRIWLRQGYIRTPYFTFMFGN